MISVTIVEFRQEGEQFYNVSLGLPETVVPAFIGYGELEQGRVVKTTFPAYILPAETWEWAFEETERQEAYNLYVFLKRDGEQNKTAFPRSLLAYLAPRSVISHCISGE